MSNTAKLITTLLEPVQRTEQALTDLYYRRRLAVATGHLLDFLGAIVGEDRQGRSDTDYRQIIAAVVAINRSTGNRSDVTKIALALLNQPGARVHIRGSGGVGTVAYTAAVSAALAALILPYLKRAVEVTSRIALIYDPDPAGAFAFASAGVAEPSPNGWADAVIPTIGGKLVGVVA
jgi:hypothetical protein